MRTKLRIAILMTPQDKLQSMFDTNPTYLLKWVCKIQLKVIGVGSKVKEIKIKDAKNL